MAPYNIYNIYNLHVKVTLGWDVPSHHEEVNIVGFKVLVDGNQLGGTLAKNVRQTVIDNLQPGKTINVQVSSVLWVSGCYVYQ